MMWVCFWLGYRLFIIARIIHFTFTITYSVSDKFCISAIAGMFKDIDQFLVGSIRTKPLLPYL